MDPDPFVKNISWLLTFYRYTYMYISNLCGGTEPGAWADVPGEHLRPGGRGGGGGGGEQRAPWEGHPQVRTSLSAQYHLVYSNIC